MTTRSHILALGAILLLATACSRPMTRHVALAPEMESVTAENDAPVPAGVTGEVFDLKYNVQDGTRYRMEMFKDQLSEITIMGQTLPTRRIEVIEGTWEILQTRVYREFFNARFTFDRVRFAELSNKGNIGYDSSLDDAPPRNERAIIMAGLVGNSIDVTITPSGRIVDVRETADMRDAILDTLSTRQDEIDPEAIERARRESLTDETFALLLETYLATLPGTTFRVGDKWTEYRPLPEMASNNERTIHIVTRNDDTITVQRESVMKPAVEGGTMGRRVSDMLAFQIESGTSSTTSRIDRETGWVIDAHTTGETHTKLLMRSLQQSDVPAPPMTTREKVIVRRLGDGVEPTPNIEIPQIVQP